MPPIGLQQDAADARAEPVIDLGELMDIFMKPLYDDLKRAVDKSPRNRRQMADVYRGAVKLAEASNLLFSRSLNRYTKRAEWDRGRDRVQRRDSQP
ncbi:MAG: hypothetical protein HYZ58_13470 [Acidobacteria bacterium]|nr:hypothetical protein [Acidobacteriota bacterium]